MATSVLAASPEIVVELRRGPMLVKSPGHWLRRVSAVPCPASRRYRRSTHPAFGRLSRLAPGTHRSAGADVADPRKGFSEVLTFPQETHVDRSCPTQAAVSQRTSPTAYIGSKRKSAITGWYALVRAAIDTQPTRW